MGNTGGGWKQGGNQGVNGSLGLSDEKQKAKLVYWIHLRHWMDLRVMIRGRIIGWLNPVFQLNTLS